MTLALVTGGCRRIGAAIAARLATAGHDLALHAHDADAEPEPALADAIRATGVAAHVFAADLADGAAVEALVARVAARFGRMPDILVNNASKFGFDAPENVTQAAMLGHYAVNCAAPAVLARAVAAAAGPGRPVTIVNLLDQRVAQPNGDQLSYTLSKLALSDLTDILARHYAPHVRVVAVAPGLTLPTEDYTPGQMERLAAAMPLARLPTPADLADAVMYLLSAGAVTGQTLFVDGGAHLRRFDRDFQFMARDA